MNVRQTLLLLLLASFACVYPASVCAVDEELIFDENVMVAMRDGTRLAANVFRPRQEGRFPVILQRTPYGKPGASFPQAREYAAAGYAMVVQDCRGRGDSEGVWDPFRYDVDDGFDTQEWAGGQPWSNGDLATAGGSYVGWTQWASAPGASRYLRTMVPVVPFVNAFDETYPGGAFQLALFMGWGALVGGAKLEAKGLAKAYAHLPLRTWGDQFETKVPYINEWVRHPTYDDYWRRRGVDYRYEEITVPILNIGGWYDIFAKSTIEAIDRVRESSRDRKARRNQFVIMGPWGHGVGVRKVGDIDFGEEAELDLGALQLRWFDYWLKGKETGVQDWPAYRLFVMGENRWRQEDSWPLERTRFTSYYLHSGGKANSLEGDGSLSGAQPAAEAPDTYVYDPKDPVPTQGGNLLLGAPHGPRDQTELERRADVLVYTSAPLTEDLEVTGPVKMILHAASNRADTDFTAKLVDVHEDGTAYNLCDGVIRARYREGRKATKLIEPERVYRYEIDLGVTSNLFKKGHRLRAEVSSSNYPRFDRNPNSDEPFGSATELLPATQTIYHDAERPSHMVLPVIPR